MKMTKAEKRGAEMAIKFIPDNWLDPLLSGKDRVIHKSPCGEIERLLQGVTVRIREAIKAGGKP